MILAPTPSDEDDRLSALRQLLILDTPEEERFDRITAFAAEEFEVPIAVVSMVDTDRTWFKSRVGLELHEAPRDVSFCGHAILQDAPFVVPDAALDERFADNPNVALEPHVRFYAGACLSLPSGHNVGTLCLFDFKPREMDRVSLAILSSLRDLVVEQLVLGLVPR
ncbi:MAG: histidine kinase [Burkholderiales bacterium PBB4]|nr:MAG: histidine kinase [Burkholderiales bacterium PBB4]